MNKVFGVVDCGYVFEMGCVVLVDMGVNLFVNDCIK